MCCLYAPGLGTGQVLSERAFHGMKPPRSQCSFMCRIASSHFFELSIQITTAHEHARTHKCSLLMRICLWETSASEREVEALEGRCLVPPGLLKWF